MIVELGKGSGIRLAGHAVRLSPEHERALEAMRSIARRGRFAPPTREAVLSAAGRPAPEARALLTRLVDSGDLAIVGEHAYDREALREIERLLTNHFREKGPFTVADLRDLTQSSRKYVVPLAEYLDGIGFTRRQGDLRIVTRPEG